MRSVQIKCYRERRLFDTIEGSRLKILIKCSNTKACPYKSDCLRTTEIILGADKEAFDEFYKPSTALIVESGFSTSDFLMVWKEKNLKLYHFCIAKKILSYMEQSEPEKLTCLSLLGSKQFLKVNGLYSLEYTT